MTQTLYAHMNKRNFKKEKTNVIFLQKQNKKAKQVLSWGLVPLRVKWRMWERAESVGVVQILCTHVCK
jgi:hypothetical protein